MMFDDPGLVRLLSLGFGTGMVLWLVTGGIGDAWRPVKDAIGGLSGF